MLCEGVVWNHFCYCRVEGDTSKGVQEIPVYIKGWAFFTSSRALASAES